MLIDDYLEKAINFKKKKENVDKARKNASSLRRMFKTMKVSTCYSILLLSFSILYICLLSYSWGDFGLHYIKSESQTDLIYNMNNLSLTLKTISTCYIIFLVGLVVYLTIKFIKKIKSAYNRDFVKYISILTILSAFFLFSILNVMVNPDLKTLFNFITINLFRMILIMSFASLIGSIMFTSMSFVSSRIEKNAPNTVKSLMAYRNEVRDHKKIKNKYIENIHSSIEEMRYLKELKRSGNLDKEDLLEILLIENAFENKNKERYALFLEEAVLKEQSLIENY